MTIGDYVGLFLVIGLLASLALFVYKTETRRQRELDDLYRRLVYALEEINISLKK